MTPRADLADLVAAWESYGSTRAEIEAAAPWAFIAPEPEPVERIELFENLRPAWNSLGNPKSREKPRRLLPAQAKLELLDRLASFALD